MAYAFKFAFPTTNFDATGATHTTIAQTGGTATAIGDHLACYITYAGADYTITSFVSSLGNTYAEVASEHFYDSGSTFGWRFFEGIATNAGTETLTGTYSSAALFAGLFCCVYTSLAGNVDSVAAGIKRSGVPASAGALVTNNCTVIAQPVAFISFAMDLSLANGDDITLVGATSRISALKPNGLATIVRMGDRSVTANGATTQTWTPAQSGSDYMCGGVAIAEGAPPPADTLMGQACL